MLALLDQKETFVLKKDIISRGIALDEFVSTSLVVLISGVRRSGKSALLYLIKEHMNLASSQWLYINCDDDRIIPDANFLENAYQWHLQQHNETPVFFIDEIQQVPNWEKFVNRMYERGHKLFITGSNANLLSSEMATALTGRNRVIHLFPFSFAEFLSFHKLNSPFPNATTKALMETRHQLDRYIKLGGFPLIVKEQNIEIASDYFKDILYRDVIARYNLTQVNELRIIAQFLASNVSKLFSFKRLQEISGIKSTSTVKNYLDFLGQTYLFDYLPKFDYSLAAQVRNSKKVYIVDLALYHVLATAFSENSGRLIENLVYLELKRRKQEVYYYSNKGECDFVLRKNLETTEAIQVVYDINADNQSREENGLLEAMHDLKTKNGLIIYYQKSISNFHPDIQYIEISEWLLQKHS